MATSAKGTEASRWLCGYFLRWSLRTVKPRLACGKAPERSGDVCGCVMSWTRDTKYCASMCGTMSAPLLSSSRSGERRTAPAGSCSRGGLRRELGALLDELVHLGGHVAVEVLAVVHRTELDDDEGVRRVGVGVHRRRRVRRDAAELVRLERRAAGRQRDADDAQPERRGDRRRARRLRRRVVVVVQNDRLARAPLRRLVEGVDAHAAAVGRRAVQQREAHLVELEREHVVGKVLRARVDRHEFAARRRRACITTSTSARSSMYCCIVTLFRRRAPPPPPAAAAAACLPATLARVDRHVSTGATAVRGRRRAR